MELSRSTFILQVMHTLAPKALTIDPGGAPRASKRRLLASISSRRAEVSGSDCADPPAGGGPRG